MTDQSLRRADELLTELVEQVETARAVPMSSSCVLPRERVLDLLDELREVLPTEIEDARRVIAGRDALLYAAYAEAKSVREKAAQEADAARANATAQAAELVGEAQDRARENLERGDAQHAALVSASSVHQAAVRAAAEVRKQADDHVRELYERIGAYQRQAIADADRYAVDIRADAEQYAGKLSADSEDYAERTLYQLTGTLQRAVATAEQGRVALAHRRSARVAGKSRSESAEEAGTGLPPDAPDALQTGRADARAVGGSEQPAESGPYGVSGPESHNAHTDWVATDPLQSDSVPT